MMVDLCGKQVISPLNFGLEVSLLQVQRSMSKFLTQNISKTVTDSLLDLPEHLYIGPMGSRLAPSDLTSNYLEGPKIKVILLT